VIAVRAALDYDSVVETAMIERDFQAEVLTALGELKAEQTGTRVELAAVKDHLARLNGRVADHERRLGELQIELAERRNQCPLVDVLDARTRTVEDFVTAEKASSKTSSAWMKWMWPVIWVAAGAFGLLILLHSADLLKFKP
jgi:septal ring factor EnvC (AmiA/AmiB activator)